MNAELLYITSGFLLTLLWTSTIGEFKIDRSAIFMSIMLNFDEKYIG